MKKILQVEVIYNAFMDTILRKLPKNEKDYPEWYKDRLDKCNCCKYNTKNIPNSMIPTGSLYFSKMLGKNRCSICSCFIKQKAWSKTEECAMGETDKRPEWLSHGYVISDKDKESKWNRLELITMDSDEFNIISTNDKLYNTDLSEDGNKFLIKLNPIKIGKDIKFSFILQPKHKINISKLRASCGCTEPDIKILDKNELEISIKINTNGFGEGSFNKELIIDYRIEGKEYKEDEYENIDFNFIGNIIN